MASIQITIPDEYVPGVVARMYEVNASRDVPFADMEEFLSDQAAALASAACAEFRVGSYYVGPVNPKFNADGTPYTGEAPGE